MTEHVIPRNFCLKTLSGPGLKATRLHDTFPATKASFNNSPSPKEAIRAYAALYLREEVQTVEGYISILEVDFVVYGNILLKFLTKVDRRTFRNSKNP